MKIAALVALLALAPVAARAEPDLHVRPASVILPRHVSAATKADPEIHAQASRLDAKRESSIGIGIGSVIVGGALSMVGVLADGSCQTVSGAKVCEPNYTLVGVGAAVGLLGVLVAIARSPRAADYRGVTETWNSRHPDAPLTVAD